MDFDTEVRLHHLKLGLGSLLLQAALAAEDHDHALVEEHNRHLYRLLDDAIGICRPERRAA